MQRRLDTEYYIGEEQVTKEKLLIYVDSNPKTKVEFSQFELSSSYPISADQAWNLANAYWNNQNGAKDHGAGTIWTARIVLTDTPNFDTDYYRFDFRIESTSNVDRVNGEDITPYYIKSYDQILVNAFTGEITTPECEAANGKCISIDDAIEISKNYRDYIDFDKEGNNYLVELNVDRIAPPHFYVISTQKLVDDHYANYSAHWIDKYTGEIIYPFYMYGKG